jgi:hypothetical protein
MDSGPISAVSFKKGARKVSDKSTFEDTEPEDEFNSSQSSEASFIEADFTSDDTDSDLVPPKLFSANPTRSSALTRTANAIQGLIPSTVPQLVHKEINQRVATTPVIFHALTPPRADPVLVKSQDGNFASPMTRSQLDRQAATFSADPIDKPTKLRIATARAGGPIPPATTHNPMHHVTPSEETPVSNCIDERSTAVPSLQPVNPPEVFDPSLHPVLPDSATPLGLDDIFASPTDEEMNDHFSDEIDFLQDLLSAATVVRPPPA